MSVNWALVIIMLTTDLLKMSSFWRLQLFMYDANRNKFGVSERAFSAYVFIRGFHIEYSPNKKTRSGFATLFTILELKGLKF